MDHWLPVLAVKGDYMEYTPWLFYVVLAVAAKTGLRRRLSWKADRRGHLGRHPIGQILRM